MNAFDQKPVPADIQTQIDNINSKMNIVSFSLGNKTVSAGSNPITFNVPSNMPNKQALAIILYSVWDNVYFQWEPQSMDSRSLTNASTWHFNILNQRGGSAEIVDIRGLAFY